MPRKRNTSRQFRQLIGVLTARRREWVHGYELLVITGMKSGTLYPLLIRMHDQGYVEARWITQDDDHRPRHVYRLTAAGAAAAAELNDGESAMATRRAVLRGA